MAPTQAELWELEREWGDQNAPFGGATVSASRDCPDWVVHLRKFICLRHIVDLKTAIQACSDEEIRGLLDYPGVMIGIAPESDLQALGNRLIGQRRVVEAIAVSCFSALTVLTKVHFRELEPALRARGIDATSLINVVAPCEVIGFHETAAYMLYSLGKHHAQRGEWSRAEALLRRAWTDVQRLPDPEAREFASLTFGALQNLPPHTLQN